MNTASQAWVENLLPTCSQPNLQQQRAAEGDVLPSPSSPPSPSLPGVIEEEATEWNVITAFP